MRVCLSRLGVGLLAAVALIATQGAAAAQSGTASLAGTISDDQKSAVPGATVTLTSSSTGLTRDAVTDENGSYQFVALPPGTYGVQVVLAGFKTSVVESVQLSVDSTQRLDVSLAVGGIEESVQVVAEAPVINSTDASLGNVINETQIRALPLEARNPVGLLSLQAGVVYIPKPDTNTVDPRYGSVSGARADQGNVTLDGIDVNDGQNQLAFTSVLRLTLDAVQEFRVTTSSYGADSGRSSGPQVSLITKSGTNQITGAAYMANRDTKFSSNEYFLKLSQLKGGNESKAPLLDKNIFGGSIGGPIVSDRLFYFFNYEHLREERETVAERSVPSDSYRDGVLIYPCASAGACPGGTVQGFRNAHAVPAGSYGMSPADLRRVDPLHIGPSQAASQYWQQFPSPNFDGRDGRNIMGYRFAAPIQNRFHTYIGRADYRLNDSNSLFGRFNAQDDAIASAPQFPGSPPNATREVKNWGYGGGHDWVLGSNKVNTLRAGYTLIDDATLGLLQSSTNTFRFLDNFVPLTSTNTRQAGTFNVINDFSWIKGRHTLKVGTNLRWIRNDTTTNVASFFGGVANASWVTGVGGRYRPGSLCPAPGDCSGLPTVAPGGNATYADGLIPLLGVISQTTANYNYTIDGGVLGEGTPVPRLFATNEYEFYMQDSWRVSDNFTLTAGLRYSLFPPIYEKNGQQVVPDIVLGDWFDERARNMAAGLPSTASPRFSFIPAGPANNGPDWYQYDKNNWAPRASFAWTLNPRTVVRGGYFLVYDRIGSGLANTFSAGGSFGLSSSLRSFVNQNNETSPAIRFTGINVVPATYPGAPPATFPATPLAGQGVITTAIDQRLRTPYSHSYNLVLSRDIGKGFSIDASYVGRQGRSLLIRRDMAMPLNITDPQSGQDFYSAAQQLITAAQANGAENVAPIAFWENLYPDAAGGGLSATQVIGGWYLDNEPDWITATWAMDQFCFPACSRLGEFTLFSEQFDALSAQSTLARAGYNAAQFSLRKRFTAGHQFDVNYTYAVAKDHGSSVERGASFGNFGSGGYSGFLVNSWEPDLQYSFADFDVRHQINVNWLAELPFGQGKRWGGNANPVVNALIGDWSIAGIYRWTSGFPFNVINCRSCWTTNWNLQGNAELVDPSRLPPTETTKNIVGGQPSPFENPTDALTYFRRQLPGETGIRNLLRGDGYFGIDLGLAKAFSMPFGHQLMFRWEVFNLTNTVRFDTGNVEMLPDVAATFGRYNGSLATCDGSAGRCMQFNARYQF